MIQEEDYNDCYEEVLELGRLHFDEIKATNFMKYNPDLQTLKLLADTGHLKVLTLRVDGELKGYSFTIFGRDLIDKEANRAQTILLYIDKELRGLQGLKLIATTEQLVPKYGGTYHIFDVPQKNNFSKILERKGYTEAETFYIKYTGG